MAEDDSTASETYELYGPKNYSMAEIAEMVDKEIIKHRRHFNLPKRVLKPMADMYNRLIWWSQTSSDSVEREFIDQKIDPKAKTFKDLDIEPGEIANFTFQYLVSTIESGAQSRLTVHTARLSELIILRSPASNREGKARGEEISTCH